MKALDWRSVPLEGVQLIEASAGTGKTYTLTTLVLRLLLERRLRIDQILIVTFTNAAASELRDRVRSRLRSGVLAFSNEPGLSDGDVQDQQLCELVAASGDRARDRALLSEALRTMDESAIFTIHGFCQRVLGEYAFESGTSFEVELLPEARALVAEVVDDFWATELYTASDVLVRYLERSGLDRGWLSELARMISARPDLTVVFGSEAEGDAPSRAPEGFPGDHLAAYVQAHRTAAELWRRSRTEIAGLIASCIVSRTKYPARSLDGWCRMMDDFMADAAPGGGGLFPQFAKFTPAALADATRQGQVPPAHPFFDACASLLERHQALSAALERERLSLIARFCQRVPSELEARKAKQGVHCFDDLLERLRSALRAEGGAALARRIRGRYPAALVDEFQDTDPVQYEVLCRVWRQLGAALFLIGDPKQAIYGFRGADVFAYLEAARAEGNQRWTLDTNYRSDPGLVRGLERLFSRCERPFLLPEISFARVAARPHAQERFLSASDASLSGLELLYVPQELGAGRRDSRIPKRRAAALVPVIVAHHLARLLAAGGTIDGRPLEAGDVAVLTRTNREAAAVQRALRAVGIEAVLLGDSSVLDSAEAEQVARLLRGLANPADPTALRGALVTPMIGLTGSELERLRGDELAWDRWVEAFRSWHEDWVVRGFVQAFSRLLRERGALPRLLGEVGGERRVTNVLHLMELLHQAASCERLGMSALLGWLDDARFDAAARDEIARDAVQLRLESDARKLKITTMHKSKGLEYGIVYCPFLWDGALVRDGQRRFTVFHDPTANGRTVLDLRSPTEKSGELAVLEEEALAEALRLTYVALTRARHRAITLCGPFNTYDASSLAWLLHRAPADGAAADAAARERIKTADDFLLMSDLRQLADDSDERISITRAELGEVVRYAPPKERELRTEPSALRRQLDVRRRTSSFSALAASRAALRGPGALGVDRDAADELLHRAPVPHGGTVMLDEFPRGTGPGTLLHSVLELCDFSASAGPERRAIIVEQLGLHRIPEEPWADTLSRALDDVFATSLDDAGLQLATVPRGRRASELEFTLPVACAASGQQRSMRGAALTPQRLAAVFREHDGAAVPPDYPSRLAQLEFPALSGFLRGFIDLVFEDAGRYYVVDWKSNHLGATLADYSPARLAEVMAEHHYVLQYHLYTVAVHRMLAQRLPDYDYERHFGGVYYLFLRGMSARVGARSGVFHDRPSASFIQALSVALEQPFEGAEAAREGSA